MKKTLILLLLFGLFATTKADPKTDFEKANALYQQQDFAGAITIYNRIIEQGFLHAETFYNLGNAHYRQGNIGLAILNYEKALKISTDDEDARHNLTLANKQIVDEFSALPTPTLQRIFNDASSVLSAAQWSFVALFFFALMLLFAALFVFVKRHNFYLVAVLLLFVFGLMTEGIAYGKHRVEQEKFAILVVANSYVKSAPATAAEDLFILHEGTKVKVLEEFEGWQKIKLPDGKIGWINQNGLAAI